MLRRLFRSNLRREPELRFLALNEDMVLPRPWLIKSSTIFNNLVRSVYNEDEDINSKPIRFSTGFQSIIENVSCVPTTLYRFRLD